MIPMVHIQRWAKEWALGCVNLRPAVRGSQEEGFTQPRANYFAQPCTHVQRILSEVLSYKKTLNSHSIVGAKMYSSC